MIIDDLMRWFWIILALIFFVGEIFTAGFFLLCFGIGAGVAAIVAILGFGILWQLAVFVVVSGITVVLSRPLADRISNPNTHAVGIDRVIGEEALVLEAINPAASRGLVRVAHEKWSAESADGTPIPAGERVKVIAVQGTHLVVLPIRKA